jgi:2-iminobutanoate/2-iminopropanoate deaminase
MTAQSEANPVDSGKGILVSPTTSKSPGMAQAVGAGSFSFVSGQVAIGADGEVVGSGDAAAQAKQCFENLSGVLAEHGSNLDHVVKLTCYLTAPEHFPGYAAEKSSFFPDNPPASTTVIVAALLHPDLLMEVEAIAYLGDS